MSLHIFEKHFLDIACHIENQDLVISYDWNHHSNIHFQPERHKTCMRNKNVCTSRWSYHFDLWLIGLQKPDYWDSHKHIILRVFFQAFYINSLPSSHHTFDLNHLDTYDYIFRAKPIRSHSMAYFHNSIQFATEVPKTRIFFSYKFGDIFELS